MLLVIWFSFRLVPKEVYSLGEEQEVEFNHPCGFLPWDIPWFFEESLICVKEETREHYLALGC